MKLLLRTLLFILLATSCNNLMDADLTERQTFIKTFNGVTDLEATAIEITSDAILLLGNMPDPEYIRTTRDSLITVVIKTDLQGNLIGKQYFPGGQSVSIRKLTNTDQYLVVGQTNALGGVTRTRVLHLNSDLSENSVYYKADPGINYKGVSLTLSGEKIIVLGSYETSDGLERPYIETFPNVASLGNAAWAQKFDLINRNYKNSKSIHYSNGSIIWASAIAQDEDNTDKSYVSIPYVQEESVFTNYSLLGENEDNISFRPYDIQPAYFPEFGFGVVGTRANPNQTGANMFFLRTDLSGNIIDSSIKYYDTQLSADGTAITKTDNAVDDFGTAIAATRDGGFVLAGHYRTGSTQKTDDILLIKIDVQGNIIWLKTIGGKGEEHITAIRETEDQGLLILGTNIVENVASMFLIKTDKNGELKN
jgi:hypothetical protein